VFNSEDVPGQTKKIESIVSRLMKWVTPFYVNPSNLLNVSAN
jgi:hypothetical protein